MFFGKAGNSHTALLYKNPKKPLCKRAAFYLLPPPALGRSNRRMSVPDFLVLHLFA